MHCLLAVVSLPVRGIGILQALIGALYLRGPILSELLKIAVSFDAFLFDGDLNVRHETWNESVNKKMAKSSSNNSSQAHSLV